MLLYQLCISDLFIQVVLHFGFVIKVPFLFYQVKKWRILCSSRTCYIDGRHACLACWSSHIKALVVNGANRVADIGYMLASFDLTLAGWKHCKGNGSVQNFFLLQPFALCIKNAFLWSSLQYWSQVWYSYSISSLWVTFAFSVKWQGTSKL